MSTAYTAQRETAGRRATERVGKMRPIDQLALFDALLDSLPKAAFRELKIKSVYDDHERYPVLACPWCREHLHQGDVIVVDASLLETASGETSPEDGVTFDYYEDDQDDPDSETKTQTLHYKCGSCGAPVSIPSGVEVK